MLRKGQNDFVSWIFRDMLLPQIKEHILPLKTLIKYMQKWMLLFSNVFIHFKWFYKLSLQTCFNLLVELTFSLLAIA